MGTTWAIYTGAVEPIPLAKRAGGFIIAYLAGTDDGPLPPAGDGTAPLDTQPDIVVRDIEVEDARTSSAPLDPASTQHDHRTERRRTVKPYSSRIPAMEAGNESDSESSASSSGTATPRPEVSRRSVAQMSQNIDILPDISKLSSEEQESTIQSIYSE